MPSKSPRKPPGKDDPRHLKVRTGGPPFDSRDQGRSQKQTPGYAEEQLHPKEKGRKLPGEGGPHEPHNNPKQKPGRGNG